MPKKVPPGRERYVIRRFVRNVWQKESWYKIAEEYSSVMPSLAVAQRLHNTEYHQMLQDPKVQRISQLLLQRLICMTNWSTREQGYKRKIQGKVTVAVWMTVLKCAAHPRPQADDNEKALCKSSLALAQFVEGFIQRLRSGLPVSVAIQCRKR